MNFLIEFYKNLDTINLIIFWGIIIVVLLLLIFSIIIVNKNTKLKKIINSNKTKENENDKQINISEDIPIIMPMENNINNNEPPKTNEPLQNNYKEQTEKVQKTIEEEKKFIVEEHVIQYNKNLFTLDSVKKTNEYQENRNDYREILKEPITKIPNEPYQENVLKKISNNQTSPIGIIKPQNKEQLVAEKAKELEISFKEQEPTAEISPAKVEEIKLIEKTNQTETNKTSIMKQTTEPETSFKKNDNFSAEQHNLINKQQEKPINITSENLQQYSQIKENKNESYLQEVSRKLSESQSIDGIDRTEYELRQEEDAIISYEELMKKKDSIKIIDEEEAVISIEELINKKKQQEKLYNISEEEENEKFINELKNFRNDL